MEIEEYIQSLTGISKRLFLALSSLRGKPAQYEDSLFQLASVIDSTSKKYFPEERSSKKRFMQYLRKNETDIFRIASGGRFTIKDSYFINKDGESKEFGEILYGIRCSSYHDPEELEKIIHFGNNNQFGHTSDGKFIVNESLVQSLLLVLFTDKENKDLIDRHLFDDNQFLIFNGTNYPLHTFLGNRKKLMELIKAQSKS